MATTGKELLISDGIEGISPVLYNNILIVIAIFEYLIGPNLVGPT